MFVPIAAPDSGPTRDGPEVGLAPWAGCADAPRNKRVLARGIGSVLKHERLTVVELSAQTRRRFGKESAYFISRTFLYKQAIGVTPHICQVVALSEITGYRFEDWMALCGFDLTLIANMQLIIPNERTTLLTPWRGLERVNCHNQTNSTENQIQDRYCFAKVGNRDAVLNPVVRPGSIVRADRCFSQEILKSKSSAEHIWLVEHPTGITCCRVKSVGGNEVVLLPNSAPLYPWPLRLSTQVRILGLVDGHALPYQGGSIESLCGAREPHESVLPLRRKDKMTLSQLIQASRLRSGLTFREAHKMSLHIARLLHDPEFRISIGQLSDYEAINRLPRHIAKIITLCVIYGIDARELLRVGGVHVKDSNKSRLVIDRESARGNSGLISKLLHELATTARNKSTPSLPLQSALERKHAAH